MEPISTKKLEWNKELIETISNEGAFLFKNEKIEYFLKNFLLKSQFLDEVMKSKENSNATPIEKWKELY